MIRRPQFTLRALLVLMLVAACFFGGVQFERERQRRADEAEPLLIWSGAIHNRGAPDEYVTGTWFFDEPQLLEVD
jgi:hypothetical protein